MNNDTNMIMETVAAVGQSLSDQISQTKSWNPEANKYSRSFNMNIMIKLIATDLTKMDIFVLFNMIMAMNSENRIGSKFVTEIDLPRMTKYRTMKTLTEKGIIFEFSDGTFMINPKIVTLSKYRRNCLGLIAAWTKAVPKPVQLQGEDDVQQI